MFLLFLFWGLFLVVVVVVGSVLNYHFVVVCFVSLLLFVSILLFVFVVCCFGLFTLFVLLLLFVVVVVVDQMIYYTNLFVDLVQP